MQRAEINDSRPPFCPRGIPLSETPHSGALCFSPDGKTLAVADGKNVKLWGVNVKKRAAPGPCRGQFSLIGALEQQKGTTKGTGPYVNTPQIALDLAPFASPCQRITSPRNTL
jgi:hypothetical protein